MGRIFIWSYLTNLTNHATDYLKMPWPSELKVINAHSSGVYALTCFRQYGVGKNEEDQIIYKGVVLVPLSPSQVLLICGKESF
ncbi:MAG: hypothetical protein HRU09_20275 [Oligoflexales bacterium]|nr:hypothetical protein [Oligoflexales bacterium]